MPEPDPLAVQCPSCLQPAGRDCLWLMPSPTATFHAQRIELAWTTAGMETQLADQLAGRPETTKPELVDQAFAAAVEKLY